MVFDGVDDEDPCIGWRDGTAQANVREAQAKADLEARQMHQMEQVYVRCCLNTVAHVVPLKKRGHTLVLYACKFLHKQHSIHSCRLYKQHARI